MRDYLRVQTQREASADVPCGTCDACCRSSYYIQIRADEHETLRRIPSACLARAARPEQHDSILDQNVHGRCPMLAEDGCSIYAHRPQTCRKYDCRAFAAAGISLGTGPQSPVNERIWQWSFDYPTELDAQRHCAVRAAAAFLQRRRTLFPGYLMLADPGQLAKAAVVSHELFLDMGDPPLRVTSSPADSEIVDAILRRLQAVRTT